MTAIGAETVAVGALVGLVGALVMNLPMAALPEGYAPAAIAAGLLTRRDHESVGDGTAYAVHHLAGAAIGLGWGAGVAALEPTFGSAWPAGLGAALVTLVALLAVFLLGVLPRVEVGDRERAITRAWVLSAFVYAVTLTFVGPLLFALR
jgi:hypothetical protein